MQKNSVLNFGIFFIITLIVSQNEALLNSIEVENIFQKNISVHSGDIMQCEILKTNILNETNKNDLSVYTGKTTVYTPNAYQFHSIAGKCFSFKVRSSRSAHIALSCTPCNSKDNRLEVLLEHHNYSCIRQITKKKSVCLNKFKEKGIINNKEYNGFWIRMLDDQLLEVGRELEYKPFLSYKFPKKWQLKYFGFMSWKTTGEWIINGDTKCPDQNNEVTEKITAKSKCFMLN